MADDGSSRSGRTRTAVVMLCVRRGRRASLVWYLRFYGGLVSDWAFVEGGLRGRDEGEGRGGTIVTC